jgi:hypothetical protein
LVARRTTEPNGLGQRAPLSSRKRIDGPANNASGLAISNVMGTQINDLHQGVSDANDRAPPVAVDRLRLRDASYTARARL